MGYDASAYQSAFPHPYITIWMECLRRANPWTGQPDYPDPTKGYLEQDADLMLGYDICEVWRQERAENKKRQEEQQSYATDFFRDRQ